MENSTLQEILAEENVDYEFDRLYKDRKTKKIELICVECKGKFKVQKGVNTEYDRGIPPFCAKCSKKVCLRCTIVLSKKYKCTNRSCHNKHHGMPSKEMPDFYCAGCIIWITG